MKIAIFILICLQSTCYAQYFLNNPIEEIALLEKKQYNGKFGSNNLSSASINFDITYLRCEWQVDPAIRFIKGKVTAYFILTSQTNTISFDLIDDLQVDSVEQNKTLISFSHQNNLVSINIVNPQYGAIDSVSIYYQGVPPNTGFGSFVNSLHAGIPVMWTLSEPYGSMDWWPCKNGLDDKADSIDVFITAPSQYTSASNGLRQSEKISGTFKTTHWKHRYPIATYLVCLAVTNYEEFTDYVQLGNINLPMQTFCYPESIELFKANTALVLASMKYFHNLFGPYPFIKEKYGHVQFGWGGGEEHQTATFIVRPDENLMSHELAHQWFGNKITCASWQHIWLNEGFATHLASMDREEKYPLTLTDIRKNEINFITSLPGGSVFVYDTTSVNRIFNSRLSYIKGSHVLYMLRWVLGEGTFLDGIHSYLEDTTIAYGFATTDDLQRNLEEASGKTLDYFFQDWIYGEGYPTYHVTWETLGTDHVRIKLNQTASHNSVDFFELPVPLLFKNATQQKLVVVNNTFNGEVMIKQIGFEPDTLIIDPDYWLVTKGNTSEKIPNPDTEKNKVQVFPSPFNSLIYLYLSNFSSSVVHIKIFDAKGSLYFSYQQKFNGSLFKEINTQRFASGTYFIKIQTSNGQRISRTILKI